MHSRRVFLKNGAMALVTLGMAPRFLARAAQAAAPSRKRCLVAIFQRGAVDGLNVVVPFGEETYYQARPAIAIPRPGAPDGAIDLDGFFGLHPRLAPLEPLYRARSLAFVHACGSPDNTRSHFDAQDYMETATPGAKATADGWLNRLLRAERVERATPFRAVSLTAQLPRSLAGPVPALTVPQLGTFGLRGGSPGLQAALEAEYGGANDGAMRGVGREAFEAIEILKAADLQRYQPAGGARYPASAFGDALRQIVQLVKADVGLEVAFAEVGGWDTHVNQGAGVGQLAGRLDDFGSGLAAMATDLGDRLADVLVVTMSEFGRTVSENGNRGTDHGHGNVMMVLGGNVRGGRVHGRWPGLAPDQRYEGRDLAVTTDFRHVFAEIATRHLGVADANVVFPGYRVEPARFPGVLAG